jgi:hypothetical protein
MRIDFDDDPEKPQKNWSYYIFGVGLVLIFLVGWVFSS